jgi:ABC-type anion transport system duplicated permease subunit
MTETDMDVIYKEILKNKDSYQNEANQIINDKKYTYEAKQKLLNDLYKDRVEKHTELRKELINEIERTGNEYQRRAFRPKMQTAQAEYRQALAEVEKEKNIEKLLQRAIFANDSTMIRAIGQVAYEQHKFELFKKIAEHDYDLQKLAEHEELYGNLRTNDTKFCFSVLISAPSKISENGR